MSPMPRFTLHSSTVLHRAVLGVLVIISALLVTPTHAQACDVLIEEALLAMGDNCEAMGRNRACYGYNDVETRFTRIMATDFFTRPADRADMEDIRTINTAPLSLADDRWGVAVLSLQADIPDTLPGQAVTFVLVGDASVEEAADPDYASPMQAFYFRTGIGSAQCQQAPDAVVVQSPDNLTVNLRANGADIEMGSTMILRTLSNPPRLQLIAVEGDVLVDPDNLITGDGTGDNTDETTLRVPLFHVIEAPLSELRPLGIDGDALNREVIDGWSTPRPLTPQEIDELRALELIPDSILEIPIRFPDAIADDDEPCELNPAYVDEYTVISGDTLTDIAERYNEDVFLLADGNCLDDANLITVGQIILVPELPQAPIIVEVVPTDPPAPVSPPVVPPPVVTGVDIEVSWTGTTSILANTTYALDLTVSNNGTDPATGLQVTDDLVGSAPAGLTNALLASPPLIGTYNIGTGLWDIGTLNAGDTFTLNLQYDVLPGFIANTFNINANVTALNEPDTNAGNNTDVVGLTVAPSPIKVNTVASGVLNGADGLCTLPEAIIAANTDTESGTTFGECEAGSGGAGGIDVVLFTVAGTLNLPFNATFAVDGNNALPSITSHIGLETLAGAVTIQRPIGAAYRIFHIGGGILEVRNDLTISQGSEVNGGGVYVSSGTFELDASSTISTNGATNGGGIYVAGGTVLITGTVTNNSATDGAGIYINAGSVETGNATVSNNNATDQGGGIYVAGGTVEIGSSSTFFGNTAVADGGGVYNSAGSVFLKENSIFDGNTAPTGAGVTHGVAAVATDITDVDFTDHLVGRVVHAIGAVPMPVTNAFFSGNAIGLFDVGDTAVTFTNMDIGVANGSLQCAVPIGSGFYLDGGGNGGVGNDGSCF
jgi:predicted outer membrane repeat protein